MEGELSVALDSDYDYDAARNTSAEEAIGKGAVKGETFNYSDFLFPKSKSKPVSTTPSFSSTSTLAREIVGEITAVESGRKSLQYLGLDGEKSSVDFDEKDFELELLIWKMECGEVLVIDCGVIFAMMAASFLLLSRYASATPMPHSVLSRGVGWQGVGILFCGIFGTGIGSSVAVENAGLLALTHVGSRRVVQISAGFMIFFSILGKFGGLFASIPSPIVAAMYCLLFAYVGM
ncbi:unnamed protein product [Fraxinus pennsylvanica]|uniref:Uncharacterized protein n=1 Tax=Fraxinus pennsylvanica TaxID=56036 RepID=A0AAD2DV67_9LAMI|nr:unnamed protein product [Fraxinus pennsylvanica]